VSRAGIIFISLIVVVTLFFMIPAFGFPEDSVDGTPGPGYFPLRVGAIILILAVILIFSFFRDKTKYFQTTENEKRNLPKLLITSGVVIFYGIVFRYIHFIPLSIAFLFFLNWLFGRTIKFNIIFSIVFTLIFYYVFKNFLHVML